MMLSVRIAAPVITQRHSLPSARRPGPAERSAFFCRTYSLVIRVIRGKHVNVLVVCNEPCVIGPLSLVGLIGHSGCPGIGEITEPSPAGSTRRLRPAYGSTHQCGPVTAWHRDFVRLFTNDVS